MKREYGQIEVWLTASHEHKVGVHSAKLSVINSANNRYIADFNTVEEAINYANDEGIEVKVIKNN